MYHKGLFLDHLFNILLCNIFLFNNKIDSTSSTNDNTLCYFGKSPDKVITKLEESLKIILKWFENNGMKINPDKCHILANKNRSFVTNMIEIKFLLKKLKTCGHY